MTRWAKGSEANPARYAKGSGAVGSGTEGEFVFLQSLVKAKSGEEDDGVK